MSSRRSFLQSVLFLPSLVSARAFAQDNPASASVAFADFEGGNWNDWTTEGLAFGDRPATDALFPGKIRGFGGNGFVCTLHPRKGSAATGKAVSREFVIEKPFITFKIGGGNFPSQACLNLVVEGKIERTATGDGTASLSEKSWDVSALIGKKARLEIVDNTVSDQRGYVLVDDIVFGEKSEPPLQKWMEALAHDLLQKEGYPGVWASAHYMGKEIGSVAVGYADVETKKPASVSDVLFMGSVSKTVVATVYAALVQRSLISYDATLGEINGLEKLSDAAKKITARLLLAHTSGFPSEVIAPRVDLGTPEANRKAELKMSLANGVGTPGAFAYSNLGYTTLATLIDAKTSHSFEYWLKLILVDEHGLSTFSSDSEMNVPSGYATGYHPPVTQMMKVDRRDKVLGWGSSGSIRATMLHICKYGLLHCGNRFNDKPLFKDSSLLELHKRLPNSTHTLTGWGRGLNRYVLSHDGKLVGHSMMVFIEPEKGLVVVASSNYARTKVNPPNVNQKLYDGIIQAVRNKVGS